MGVQRTVVTLLLAVVGLFVFAVFLMPPLYDAICDLTGLNGKTGDKYEYEGASAGSLTAGQDANGLLREVTVRFVTNGNAGMSWEFRALVPGMQVPLGQMNEAMFYARNPSTRPMVGQAIPSVVPGRAASYLHKTECFCFEQQVLQPGEAVNMPMRFIIDRSLPDSVVSVALSYTLYDITQRPEGKRALVDAGVVADVATPPPLNLVPGSPAVVLTRMLVDVGYTGVSGYGI